MWVLVGRLLKLKKLPNRIQSLCGWHLTLHPLNQEVWRWSQGATMNCWAQQCQRVPLWMLQPMVMRWSTSCYQDKQVFTIL
eukprot:symbB.v1.2.020903.t1/scaffold1783.1/size101483/4